MNKEIQNFIYWYMKDLYSQYYDRQHPYIAKNQFQRCHDMLTDFMTRDISITELQEMAVSFFEQVKYSDHNINHFCTEGMLKMRYAVVFGDWSEVQEY